MTSQTKSVKLWDWFAHIQKEQDEDVHFLKISLLVQFGEKIKATLCSDDSII